MEILITAVFLLGYSAIATEQQIRINKSASALVTGVLCWVLLIAWQTQKEAVDLQLRESLSQTGSVLFFLLGAMTIVELIDAHDGFSVITEHITTRRKRQLLWLTGLFTFFLSALLDNLTTTIIMISLVRKLVPEHKDRMLFAGIIVIAANAGGAWSPMGDVTTTMLWIGRQITAGRIILRLFVPSLVCVIVSLISVTPLISNAEMPHNPAEQAPNSLVASSERRLIFFAGIISLLLVPVFKALTGLPPVMGILLALGVMWMLSEILHRGKPQEERGRFSVSYALHRIDTSTILFFLGILLCISALESSRILETWAQFLMDKIGHLSVIVLVIGLLSAVIDNVPLVAAMQGMYPLAVYPTDHFLWEFVAYAAGTGGSILVIGSAAGVTAMGMEKLGFFWYIKKISWIALLAYLAGAGAYLLEITLIQP